MTSKETRTPAAAGRPTSPTVAKRAGTAKGLPAQVTVHGMRPTPAIERALGRKLAWLRRYYPRIVGCRVTVESPHRHHRKGRLYRVRVDLTVPGGELAVTRGPSPLHQAHEDPLVAIRDAFDAARRELMDYARRQRGQVKAHAGLQRARVTRLEADHGFLETEDGREAYFHRNGVLDGFDQLSVGTEVRFAEEHGDQGLQASSVAIVHPRLLGKRRRGGRP